MKLKELLEEHVLAISYAGDCKCGEVKYDLITDDNLIYPPVHESVIESVRPDLLNDWDVEGKDED